MLLKHLIGKLFCWACWLCVLLAACGPLDSAPSPTPPLLPVGAGPARPAGPAAEVSAQGVDLPGRLVFVQAGDLWVWQGASGARLTEQGNLFHPAFSPDGTRIACVRRGESFSDIVIVPAGGGEPLQLTNNGSTMPSHSYERVYDTIWAFYPTFSPDGSRVAFASQYGPAFGSPASDYNLSLFVTPAGVGGGRTQIYASDEGNIGRMAYGPDGSLVFGLAPAVDGPPQLRRASDGGVAAVAGAPENSYDPAFSPDGAWLAFAARDGGRTDVLAVPAAGGAPVRLTSLGTARAPAFSPDGAWLAFLAVAPGANTFDLWVVDITLEADGLRAGQPRQLTEGLGLDADSGLSWAR